MKKHLIYIGMFLAAIGFSACNEDFKDWADPQSNPQEESAGQLTGRCACSLPFRAGWTFCMRI